MNAPTAFATRLAADDSAGIGRLAGLFRGADYTEATILGALNGGAGRSVDRSEIPLLIRRLPDRGPLATLIRLFTLGVAVPVDVVARECAPVTPDLLESLGLVVQGAAGVTARVRVHPYADLFIASDPLVDDVNELPPDYVLGVNGSSVSVAAITIRRPAESALDLGTGQGIQALLAARHCGRVVATDINPRALNFAAFNAALNGVRNVEFREGSLFEPVKGETFDLVVCNPPYVISPESGLQFRDGGSHGDALCRSIVRGIPAHLNPGGFASIRCSWALRSGEAGTGPLGEWVEGSGCDALLMHSLTESPLEYASGWNRLLMTRRPEEFEARLNRWLDYFRSLGIEGIATGGLVLRRRPQGAPWVRSEALPLQGDPGGGRLILRLFEAQDWLATSPDPLAAVFSLAPELRIDQSCAIQDGRLGVFKVDLSFVSGMQVNVTVDPSTARVLSALDGARLLGAILGSMPEDARDRLAANVLRLHSLGFLVR